MSTPEEIRDNLSRVYPSDSFQVIQSNNYCISSFNGELLMKIKTDSDENLLVLKLRTSSGPKITNNEVFEKAFPWVYKSKGIDDVDKRRDFLKEQLSASFSNYNVIILMFKTGHSWSAPYAKAKANAVFSKDYGDHDIIVVLY